MFRTKILSEPSSQETLRDIFNHSLLLQIIPLCALFRGLTNHDQFSIDLYILSQTVLFCGGLFPSFFYILLINLGSALMYHVILVSVVVAESFELLLCIARTYSDILGEVGTSTRATEREQEIQI